MKVIAVELSPALPGLRKKGPTLPPEHTQKRSTAMPLVVSKPVPPRVTAMPCTTTVSTLATPMVVLSAAIPTPLMPVMLGNPAAAEPSSSALAGWDGGRLESVSTT